ncbi:MAG: YcjF family protein [Amphritea sp.]
MSTKPKNEDLPPYKEGRRFDLSDSEAIDSVETRKAKTFTPEEDERLSEVPEAITAGERLPHVSEYSGIRLEALPIKGLKSFFIGVGVLLAVLLGWDIYNVFTSALDVHWIAAGVILLLLVTVLIQGLRLVWGYIRDRDNQGALSDIQDQAQRLAAAHDFGNASSFINKLQAFYAEKPQAVYYQRCIDELPDYSNDREVVEHIERVFVQQLDKEALRRVSKFSLQTGAAVAVSPWASLDMILSLWRSVKMIDEVAQVYGIRPSIANRYKLLKMVIHQLVFVGATEIVIDQVMSEFGASALSSIASVRIGQGLGAGIYTARIGIAAMVVSRPIEFGGENKPKLKSVIQPMISNMKSLFKKSS